MSHHHHNHSDNFSQEDPSAVPVAESPEAEAQAEAAAEAAEAAEAQSGEDKGGSSPDAGQAAPPEPSMEEKLEAMRNNYLRALADNENTRKRMAREMQDLRESTRMNTIGEIVGIFDLLKMAADSTEKAKDMATIQMGVRMIFDQFKSVLANMGVSVIDAMGHKFDPQLHEAVSTANSDDVPEGFVLQQWNFGFKLGDRILRPARVVVSAGPRKEEPAPPAAPDAAKPSGDDAGAESPEPPESK